MEHKEELIEKVERYLSGKLSREEVKEDQGPELSSEELDEAIDLYNTTKDLIELSGMREDLKSIHEEYIAETEKPVKQNSFRLWASVAMAAALLAIAVFSGIFEQGEVKFEDYFEPYPDIVSMRGTTGDLNEALRLYSLEQYTEALAEFNKIQVDSINDTILFYQAVSALAIAKFDLAVDKLNTLRGYENNTFWQQTKWYLALALWQKGEIDEAKTILGKIGRGESDFPRAQNLLESL